MTDQVKKVTLKLLHYCASQEWAGYDPYDALNSRLIQGLPFLNCRVFRLGITQVMKRLPFNLRPLFRIPKTQNPKAIALFLAASLKLEGLGLSEDDSLVAFMTQRLVDLRSPRHPYWCWGYSFPWQTRKVVVPRGAPNLVCTCFVANALLDTYEKKGDSRALEMARSAAEYILQELYWEEGNFTAGFSYPLPSERGRVHNANFLAAALLCRIYKVSGEKKFLEPALRATDYSAKKQQENGSWAYGEHPKQRWVDNFHTGYNLCALRSISEYAGVSRFEDCIRKGFDFYREHFFRRDGAPKYFHDRAYPLDIHCVAQSIITLSIFSGAGENTLPLAFQVLHWAMAHMWNERGYFYYQEFPFFKSTISYMRWSQAWMLLALSTLLERERHLEAEKWGGRENGGPLRQGKNAECQRTPG